MMKFKYSICCGLDVRKNVIAAAFPIYPPGSSPYIKPLSPERLLSLNAFLSALSKKSVSHCLRHALFL